jgi:predicted kinase
MVRYKTLQEGINDKYSFKAVFTVGGAGSGKSTVSSLMFGVDKASFTTPSGIKVVNSDIIFEKKMKDADLTSIMNPEEKEQYKAQMQLRNLAKELTAMRVGMYIGNMLPLLIDGTGRQYHKIKDQKDVLEQIGYDTAMIFVNTSYKVAQERNSKRDRVVPENYLKQSWEEIQENIGKFQQLFGMNNFFIIDNNTAFPDGSPEAKEFSNRIFKLGMKILDRPLKNETGKTIIEVMKRTGTKTLFDLNDTFSTNFKV